MKTLFVVAGIGTYVAIAALSQPQTGNDAWADALRAADWSLIQFVRETATNPISRISPKTPRSAPLGPSGSSLIQSWSVRRGGTLAEHTKPTKRRGDRPRQNDVVPTSPLGRCR